MKYWLWNALDILRDNHRWMGWNLFLGLVPLALSVWLFRMRQARSLLWVAGFVAFIAFLPNAPYVLTDIIHLIREIRESHSIWTITLVLIPLYLAFMGIGFQAYVLSLINLGYYLRQQGWGRYVREVELVIHALSAIGVYLGRFVRFNSWDLVTRPRLVTDVTIDVLLSKQPLLVMIVTFLVIAALYWPLKHITLAVTERTQKPSMV
ncbi:MAG: DUF1361 domain-containing protein [Leptolyngbyaceae cyanobacterium bins.59]|nr:DUF1361 domain-containing protein [Leptolyngbyaceae cyanobacterium bins.59]